MPGLTGVVVGRPTAEDSIVLTPVGVPSISFAIRYASGRTRAWLKTKNPNFQGICEANWLLRARRTCARRQAFFFRTTPLTPLNEACGFQDAPLHRC